MQDNPDFHVFGTHRIDVVLNVSQRAAIGLVLFAAIVIDVIDNLLLAISFIGTGIAGNRQHQSYCDGNRCYKSGKKSHEFLPNVTVMRRLINSQAHQIVAPGKNKLNWKDCVFWLLSA